MSPSRRARAHRSIAETIEALHGDDPTRAGELAHHWSAAVQPADTTKALHYAQLAGDRALDQLAPHDALRWYVRALELLDHVDAPSRQHIELLIGLGTAQRLTGHAEYRETLLSAAHLADETDFVDLLVQSRPGEQPWMALVARIRRRRSGRSDSPGSRPIPRPSEPRTCRAALARCIGASVQPSAGRPADTVRGGNRNGSPERPRPRDRRCALQGVDERGGTAAARPATRLGEGGVRTSRCLERPSDSLLRTR